MSDSATDLRWIIPCCSIKRTDAELIGGGIFPSSYDGFTQLQPYRKILIESLTSDFDSWECGPNNVRQRARASNESIQTGRRFSALDRYDGKLYKRLTAQAIQAILNRSPKFDFLILSALYGLLHPEDGIAYYNLMMGDRCSNVNVLNRFKLAKKRASVYALWKTVAHELLSPAIQPALRVYCLLSGNTNMGYQGVAHIWRQALGQVGFGIKVEGGNSAITPPTHGRFLNYCLVNGVSTHEDIQSVAVKFNCRIDLLW